MGQRVRSHAICAWDHWDGSVTSSMTLSIIFPHVFTCTYNYLAVGMSILELGPIAFGGTAAIIAFFQGKGLLANNINCAQCGVAMVLSDRADISDGCRWWCPQCRKCVKGSFFEKSRLSLRKWLLLMHWWAQSRKKLK